METVRMSTALSEKNTHTTDAQNPEKLIMDPDDLKKPFISEELAIQLAWDIYGLKVVSLTEMVSYDDKNFHIKVSPEHVNPHINKISEDGYTLKITNTVKTALDGHFDCMHSAMQYAQKRGLRLPQPVKNLDCNTWTVRTVPVKDKLDNVSTDSCGVHMLTFIAGVPVSTIPYNKDILHQWGALLAQFHNAMEDFPDRIRSSEHIFWSLHHIPEIVNYMNGLDEDKTQLVLSVLGKFPEEMESAPLLKTGWIHADFNENNLLVQKLELGYQLDGILDLEDMHYGTYAWDVGLMLAYISLGCEDIDPIKGMGHALKSYLQTRSMTETELSFLKTCITGRLCQSLVFGAYNYRRDPTNSYVLESAKNGWSRLKLIWETPNDTLLKKWNSVE